MDKLCGINVNRKMWSVEITGKGKCTFDCKLINNLSRYSYNLHFIKGIEQVGEDEFLIFSGYDRENAKYANEIRRCRLEYGANDRINDIYRKSISDFEYINDDLILFKKICFEDGIDICERMDDTNGKEYFMGVYSIRKNKMLKDADWIDELQVEVAGVDNVSECILLSKPIDDVNSIFFTVDTKFFAFIRCYDTLRDDEVLAKNQYAIKKLIKDAQKQSEIIKQQLPIAQKEYNKTIGQKLLYARERI